MVLVNGAEGIGTGWSTTIPNYNPADIVANLKRLMEGEAQVPMHPWYRGFKGQIEEADSKTGSRSYLCSGIISQVGAVLSSVLSSLHCLFPDVMVQRMNQATPLSSELYPHA